MAAPRRGFGGGRDGRRRGANTWLGRRRGDGMGQGESQALQGGVVGRGEGGPGQVEQDAVQVGQYPVDILP